MNQPEAIPQDIADALGRAAPRLGLLNSGFHWYQSLGSTNDAAARLAERGAPEGTVVAADAQSAGRGRLGRTWVSPPGAGLYVSILLRPVTTVIPLLTIAAGVAIANGIQAATGLAPTLKWPNDVHAGGRKVAGILAEGGEAVVVGFGINVRPAALPADIAARATSLEGELGREVDRALLVAECLAAMASCYEHLRRGERGVVLAAWRARAADLVGRSVEWKGRPAIAEGIADDGALLVRTETKIERVISGEVRWM